MSTTAADKGPDSEATPSTTLSASVDDNTTEAQAEAAVRPTAENGASVGRGEPVENGNHEQQEDHSHMDDGRSADEHDDDAPVEGDRTDSGDRIAELEAELDRVTNEKDTLESQYRGLLGKLTNMRNTLGDKLRQDAVRLQSRMSACATTRHGQRGNADGSVHAAHRRSSTVANSK